MTDVIPPNNLNSKPPLKPSETETSDSNLISENPSKKRSVKKITILIIVTFLAAIATFMLSATIWYNSQIQPLNPSDDFHIVKIEAGSSSNQISEMLQEKNIIKNARAFEIYLKLNNTPPLKAGDYRLSGKQSVSEIADIISKGEVSMFDILIPPGLRLDQIKNTLLKAGFTKEDIESGLQAIRDHPLLKNLPKNTLVEGYIFPDTYKIGHSTDAETLLRLTLDTFNKQISADIKAGLARQDLSLEDAVILASIIQKEVSDYPDQQKVAQVFIKRLKQGMPLGADPTFKYAAELMGVAATPDLDSPYNTRIYAGLPPTAISNFGISALKALANPSNTDYLYFVSGDDGKTHFTRTLAEHEAATKKYCTTLCQ